MTRKSKINSSPASPLSRSGTKLLSSILRDSCGDLAPPDQFGVISRQAREKLLFRAIDLGLCILLRQACKKHEEIIAKIRVRKNQKG